MTAAGCDDGDGDSRASKRDEAMGRNAASFSGKNSTAACSSRDAASAKASAREFRACSTPSSTSAGAGCLARRALADLTWAVRRCRQGR
ncbi:MAG: hypothetical protein AW07_01191 [Candidatus Accumulibacter sp. SK-11]|nr:MAG: hypothetical protein AW07_01191 [Candidatus Accumulibacter sp. SK-11]